jgi:hypothetical protein
MSIRAKISRQILAWSEGAEVACGWAKAVEFAARYSASFERDFMLNETAISRHLQMLKKEDIGSVTACKTEQFSKKNCRGKYRLLLKKISSCLACTTFCALVDCFYLSTKTLVANLTSIAQHQDGHE